MLKIKYAPKFFFWLTPLTIFGDLLNHGKFGQYLYSCPKQEIVPEIALVESTSTERPMSPWRVGHSGRCREASKSSIVNKLSIDSVAVRFFSIYPVQKYSNRFNKYSVGINLLWIYKKS